MYVIENDCCIETTRPIFTCPEAFCPGDKVPKQQSEIVGQITIDAKNPVKIDHCCKDPDIHPPSTKKSHRSSQPSQQTSQQ